MFADRQASAFEDALFAHPVLRRGPGEVADFVGVAPDRMDVVLLGGLPVPVELEFGEAAVPQNAVSHETPLRGGSACTAEQ